MLGKQPLIEDPDKLDEVFPVRVPEILKHELDKLTPPQKTELVDHLRNVMSKHVHNAKFNPAKYLSSSFTG